MLHRCRRRSTDALDGAGKIFGASRSHMIYITYGVLSAFSAFLLLRYCLVPLGALVLCSFFGSHRRPSDGRGKGMGLMTMAAIELGAVDDRCLLTAV